MSEQDEAVTLELVGQTLREFQADLREQRRELRNLRSLLLAQAEHSRCLEQRTSKLHDDLKLRLV